MKERISPAEKPLISAGDILSLLLVKNSYAYRWFKRSRENNLNISFKGVDAEGIFLATKDDYAFSNGSACNSGSHAPSYVLEAMGLPESRINEAIRISWNHNTKADFQELVKYINCSELN